MLGRCDIGIDLGTATVLAYMKGRGIVLREPSMVAINTNTRNILAVGDEARRMPGRTPANVKVIRPLRDGSVQDFDVTERMLRYFLRKNIVGRRALMRPYAIVLRPQRRDGHGKAVDCRSDAGRGRAPHAADGFRRRGRAGRGA